MTKIIHPIAAAVALLTTLTFWLSTFLSELSGDLDLITGVKTLIPWGLLILLPAMAAVGASGFRMGQKRRGPVVEAKRKRMPIIAANGILILIPSALYLSAKAQAAQFDAAFVAVQTIELIAGAINITLLSLSMRDGLRLTGKLRRKLASSH
ncbi:hypothetical protein [Paracoccus albus]|uniref:hypothetical protein n=1 Tax=Paracoccus albus TaxID=3017784 RepID=UPI0022F09AFF|nr:hypothetical protein [Paracoccus albus]WBU61334.1 hypothetical protein PAF20_05370 [Paracoccus albus]